MTGLLRRLFRGPARSGPSIYEHITAHINPDGPGLLPEGEELPDEPPRIGMIQWAAGAMDGVASHHMGAEKDQRQVRRVVKLLRRAAEARTRPISELDRELADVGVVGLVDEILQGLVAEKLEVSQAATLGRRMATEGRARNTVKLGLALLGPLPGTDNRDLFLTLGRHDEFTLYAAVALGSSHAEPDRALWELATLVTGWGRIHVVERLAQTSDPEIREWILRTGFHNAVMDEYLVYIAATTGRLVEALDVEEPDDELINAACDIVTGLIRGGPAQDITEYESAPRALELLLGHLEHRGDSVHHFLAVYDIEEFLADDDRWTGSAAPAWPEGAREALREKARAILARPEWATRAATELAAADPVGFYEAERAARTLGIDTLEANLKRLATDETGGGWYTVMNTVDEARLPRVLEMARASIPLDTLTSGPGMELGLGPEFRGESDLEWIVQGLERFPGQGWDFIATALRSRVIRGRWTAIRTLDQWPRSAWPPGTDTVLREASKIEPDKDVRAGMTAMARGDRLPMPQFDFNDAVDDPA